MKTNLNKQTVYLPFKGGSIYGKGVIREKDSNDSNIHKYIFEGKRGSVYFNSLEDYHMKGVELIFTPKELENYTEQIAIGFAGFCLLYPKNSNLTIEEIFKEFLKTL